MSGTRANKIARVAGLLPGCAAIAALVVGAIGPSQAAWFGAGWGLTLLLLARGSTEVQDPLYPARLQLARSRRSEEPADVMVVLPSPLIRGRSESQRNARAARSVLRVTDGAVIVPSLGGHAYGVCAVLEPDARARTAIERRIRDACVGDVSVGWASFPEHGVTLESLIDAAADRVPDLLPQPAGPRMAQPAPGQQLASHSLDPGRLPDRTAH